MTTITIIWLLSPLLFGIGLYLVPKLGRYIALTISLLSMGYAVQLMITPEWYGSWQLLDSFGITFVTDALSSYFILTNALVTIAVVLFSWQSGKTAFFYVQLMIVHASVNTVFICADFITLYVALELLGIAVFLLIAYPRTERSIWLALRYLFVSSAAMLFYLIGAILVYQSSNSFAFEGLEQGSSEAVVLILLGLLTKGGIFILGFWSPLTNSESETSVSALLSGIVEKGAVFPLVRLTLMLDDLNWIIILFGVGTVYLGVTYAIFEQDTKGTLAFSTFAQLGWILVAPTVGGFYALAHGLAKVAIFFITDLLPSRNFNELQNKPIQTGVWVALVIPCLSISGFPLVVGFGAKMLTLDHLLPPLPTVVMDVAAVATAVVYAKFIFLPRGGHTPIKTSILISLVFLLSGLVISNYLVYEAYTLFQIGKAIIIVLSGWLGYFLIKQWLGFGLPRNLENFEHLIGIMSLTVVGLLGIVLA